MEWGLMSWRIQESLEAALDTSRPLDDRLTALDNFELVCNIRTGRADWMATDSHPLRISPAR